ncbi:MFS transporter [Vibrio rumoiensis]|uniref:MFS transporter n=1 Tax=Vibrio rumoiensis 1S-45 TaxID=1188252 RepID=A0A1E5E5M7_9VIBR|nr:MFS transporter [Vibrio rumoiensis]OEF29208.1 MFS transporter [Vibrio rumoiensis 1S-45]
MPTSPSTSKPLMSPKNKTMILVIGVLLIAANLRAPVTGIAPMIDLISQSFQLSATQAGMLTTLPLIGFALFAPPSAYLAKKFGLEYTIFSALVLIAAGLLFRSVGNVSALFIGTALIGVGVSIGNVLLPIVVKRDFPMKVAIMTSSYVLAMGIASGAASAFSIPLANDYQLGWQGALAALSILTFIAMIFWLPQLPHNSKPTTVNNSDLKPVNLWNKALAWQVSLYLGLGSYFTYTVIAWLPSILIQTGFSSEEAGIVHGVFQIGTALPGIFIIPLMAKLNDQRLPAFSICFIAGVCSVGLLYLPQFSYAWSFLLGLCSGAWFILGLSFISLRTSSPLQATTLSGMAQFIGYSLAAIGPMLGGYLHSIQNGWGAVIIMIVIVCATAGSIGLLAGRKTVID